MTTSQKKLIEFRGDESPLEEDYRWALAEKTAGSSVFSRATQLRAILLYVVRNTILLPDKPIHESEIAHRVLGRRMDFNPLDDNIVRVQMAHLRKKLDLYFSTEGKDEEITIAIALGSYKPVFTNRSHPGPPSEWIQQSPVKHTAGMLSIDGEMGDLADSQPREDALPPQVAPARRHWALARQILGGIAILALAACCLVLWVQDRAQQASIDQMQRSFYPWRFTPAVSTFWSGFVGANRGTDVVMSDAFFKLAQDMSGKAFTLTDYLSRSFVHQLLAQQKSPETRKVLSKVSTWSSANANHLNLARRILALDPLGNKIHLYFAHDYRADLIGQDNVILLGSHVTNPWDYLFDGRLNFSIKLDSNGLTTIVNRAPAAGERSTYSRTDSVGYCVVAYLPNPDTSGKMLPNQIGKGKVLLIEGTSVEATEAGGDFLFSQERMSNFQKKLNSSDYPYFEVLLKTSQLSGTPLTATVEAYRTYPNLH